MAQNTVEVVINAKDHATATINKLKTNMTSTMQSIQDKSIQMWKIVSVAFAWIIAYWVKSAAELEQTKVAFVNLYWSVEKADKTIRSLTDFANKTPFDMKEVANVALKLKNIAWITDKELIPLLTKLGDISSSQWKGLTQMVEAFNDAIMWENERLKEFWIIAKKHGDMVAFTFKWVTTEVAQTKEWIGKYLSSIWEMQWIHWGMEQQSKTLNWTMSTFKDTIWTLTRNIVWMSETWEIVKGGLFDKMKNWLTETLKWVELNKEWIKEFGLWILSFLKVVWEGISILFNFIVKHKELAQVIGVAIATIVSLNIIIWASISIAQTLTTTFWILSLASKALGTALSFLALNPVGAVILAIGSGVAIWVLLYKNWELIKATAIALWNWIMALYQKYKILFLIFTPLIAFWMEVIANWDLIKAKSFDLWTWIHQAWLWIKNFTIEIFTWVYNFIYEKIQSLVNFVNSVKNTLASVSAAASKVASSVSSAVSSWVNAISWTRATWWPVGAWKTYLVWERWPELFTPKWSWKIIANNKLWGWGISITVNMWWVTANNWTDINWIANIIISKITRQLQLSKLGIN